MVNASQFAAQFNAEKILNNSDNWTFLLESVKVSNISSTLWTG